MNGQPLGRRNTIRFIVLLIILMGATQTLLHQWGYGATVPPDPPPERLPDAGPERFVPAPLAGGRSTTLEMRGESTVQGSEIRLKQVFRWSNADAPAFTQVGELVIGHFDGRTPFRVLSLDEIRQTLHDAGVNLGLIRFAGPIECTVSRTDVAYDEGTALDQWIDARDKSKTGVQAAGQGDHASALTPVLRATPTEAPGTQLAGGVSARGIASAKTAAPLETGPVHTLKDLLLSDLSMRLTIPATDLQVNFNPTDQKLLILSEPAFKFNISARYIHNLGDVQWDVLVVTDNGSKKVTIDATARAWENEVVLLRPLTDRQVLQATDVTEKRALVDRVRDEPLLSMSQVVGQQTARSMKPGQVFTSRMVDAVPLVTAGQFVTVNLQQGNVRVKTVVRATEGGSYGQTIRVRNESTRDTYEVTLTGPQEAVMGPAPAPIATPAGGTKAIASNSGE